MSINVVPPVPAPVVPKIRTITLTNRAPVKIIEDDWPVVAEGGCCENDIDGPPWGWSMSMKVRRREFYRSGDRRFPVSSSGELFIIHATYRCWDETREEDRKLNQQVRVGHLITDREYAIKSDKHILQVGDELRERIECENLRKYVTYMVDACFANLGPQVL